VLSLVRRHPLVEVPRLPRGSRSTRWVKNDRSPSSLSFKDRVVATAINAAPSTRTIGCVHRNCQRRRRAAARAGLKAWIFIPEDLETAKMSDRGYARGWCACRAL